MYGWKLISAESLPGYGLFSEVTNKSRQNAEHHVVHGDEWGEGLKALSERQKVRVLKLIMKKNNANFLLKVQWLRCAIRRKALWGEKKVITEIFAHCISSDRLLEVH